MPHKEILLGHTSQETAYEIADYPYGWSLRCKIRYWLESNPRYGCRLVSQTTNPKMPGEVWNKPKPSGYSDFAVMYRDEQGHVHHTACASYNSVEDIIAFKAQWFNDMDNTQRASFMLMLLRAVLLSREAWLRWLITKGYLEINSWHEQNRVVFYRLMLGLNKDTCPKETAIAEMPKLFALLAARPYADAGESFYHLFDEPVLCEPKTETTHATWRIGEKKALWSGNGNPPKIGTRVNVTMNSFGRGVVRAYFIESGYMGVEVIVEKRPEWHIKQNGDDGATPLVFGAEVEPLPK